MIYKIQNLNKSNFTLPLMIITVFALILGMLLGIIHRNSIINQEQTNDALAIRYSKVIEVNLEGNINFLNLLASEMIKGNLPESSFQNKVNQYLNNHPEFINITWVDSNFTIKSVCPLKGNSHIIGLKIDLPKPKNASRLAKAQKRPIYTEPFEAIQGTSSFEVWNPIFNKNKFRGFFAAVYSSNKVINTWVNIDKYSNTYFNFLDKDNELITDLPNSKSNTETISKDRPLTSLNNGLKLQVKSEIESPFTPLIIIVILLLCFLILGISYSLWKLKNTQILLQKKEIILTNQNIDLKSSKNKAEESDRLKSAFLANMSHEIRTPMNGILGFSNLLKQQNLSGEKQQEYIRIIEKSGVRMLSIINDIISISKIESGQMELNIQETNINEQIEYIYNFFKPEIDAKGLQISFNNSLSNKDAILRTDREKIFGILTNLIKNAIKYSEKGTIEYGYNTDGNELDFYVKDSGVGIPKNRQKAIFERFIQADIADKMARQGAGLGLSISKAYVEMLGGKIWVKSKEGIGSSFHFTIPYQTEQKEGTTKTGLICDDKIETEKQIQNLKMLITEDDEASEILITLIVEKYCSKILKAKTGKEAVEICHKNPDINVILMDIQMPDMNGYEATRQIRKFNKKVIIIAQTAFSLTGDRQKALDAGCNDYITKPIKKEELLTLIQKTIEIE